MSLNEAYALAQLAHYRLLRETSKPNRNLRVVVGHLMQYESLRTHIVATEQENLQRRYVYPPSRPNGSQYANSPLQRKPSSGQLRGRRLNAVPTIREVELDDEDDYDDKDDGFSDEFDDDDDDDDDEDDDDYDADEWVEDLALVRSSSRTSSQCPTPPHSPPELEEDDDMGEEEESTDEEAVTPNETVSEFLPSTTTHDIDSPSIACRFKHTTVKHPPSETNKVSNPDPGWQAVNDGSRLFSDGGTGS